MGKLKGPTTTGRQVSPNTEKIEYTKNDRDKEETPGIPYLTVLHRELREFKREDFAIRAETFREVVNSMGVGELMNDLFATPSNTLC